MSSPSLSIAGLAAALALVGAACIFDTAGKDLDAGGIPDADLPDATVCTGTAATCLNGSRLQVCENGFQQERECPLGCIVGATPDSAHCGEVVPANGLDPEWLLGANRKLVVDQGETIVFETSTGTIQQCNSGVLHTGAAGLQNGINFQAPGGTVPATWAFLSLEIKSGGVLRVIGNVPGALLVSGDVRVEGSLEASAGGAACSLVAACGAVAARTCGGPGGGAGGLHDADGAGDGHGHKGVSGFSSDETGGGGAGFGDVGGGGGGMVPSAGGISYGTAGLEPLVAGSGGGGGGEAVGAAGVGGGGGGALQLTVLGRLEVRSSGVLRAAGAGGGAGLGALGNGGGGGGSGGAFLLEAPRLQIEGVTAANGGGGGAGGNDSSLAGADGVAGTGGAAGGTGLQAGGTGGALLPTSGGAGKPIGTAFDGTGGGGGAAGRIFLRTLTGGLELSGAKVSPSPGEGTLVVE